MRGQPVGNTASVAVRLGEVRTNQRFEVLAPRISDVWRVASALDNRPGLNTGAGARNRHSNDGCELVERREASSSGRAQVA